SLINTLLGMRIDIETRRPVLRNNTGGLSGPAVFPVALRMVWQAASAVKIPVLGLGGVSKWQDAAEMLLAGASLVGVGTASIAEPFAPLNILKGLEMWLDSKGIESPNQLRGKVEAY
ncbi:MAG: dihydroorotate dehydrogenase, partial [Oscillospiraceae bacterium]|nr:dihydroorotate dehydrogenase [Oscillospiraceae bacterium]